MNRGDRLALQATLACGLIWLGWAARGFAEPEPPRVELRRIEVPAILPAATYFQCPVTWKKIAEWKESCKVRERTHSVKPREGK